MLLRSTGKVKRGLGTIRQDVNISIAKGARVEVKGVQALDLIETIVENEVERQANLLVIKGELVRRGASVCNKIFDVTGIFGNTQSKVIKKSLKNGKVLAVLLPGFEGLIGREIQSGRRLGTEFSDRAKTSGVGGIFHTDELPDYGITKEEVVSLRDAVGAHEGDAVVMVADREKRARGAMEAVIIRAEESLEIVPEETRRALPDGNTAYMRPLPGAARMYPETDVPQIEISAEYFGSIELPELLTERAKRFTKEFGLNNEFADKIVYSRDLPLFEDLIARFADDPNVSATLIVRTLTGTVPELKRDGVAVERIMYKHFMHIFDLVSSGSVAKEGIGKLLRAFSGDPSMSAEDAISSLGLVGIDTAQIETFIEGVVKDRQDFVKEKGMAAVGPLMGVVMGEFRGKVDGKVLSEVLNRKINDFLVVYNL